MIRAHDQLLWVLVSIMPMLSRPAFGIESPPGCLASSPKDLLGCALKNSPEISLSEARTKRTDSLVTAAGQRPNPELDVQAYYGKLDGESQIQPQITLSHTFELGGKRSARIDNAEAKGYASEINYQKTLADTATQVVAAMYRLRQIKSEAEILQEAIDTFDKTIRRFKSKIALSPDNQASLKLFELAQSEHRLRQASLLQEQNSLESDLSFLCAADTETIGRSLPPVTKEWPKINVSSATDNSPGVRQARGELKLSDTELELARSEAWPNLKIGPSFQMQNEGKESVPFYGVVFTLPLPLYQRNEGGKALAVKDREIAERALEIVKAQSQRELKNAISVYDSSVHALSTYPPPSQEKKKEASIEDLFARGLISSASVIEMRRQLFEYAKSRNEQELKAIRLLWVIYSLQGKAASETP